MQVFAKMGVPDPGCKAPRPVSASGDGSSRSDWDGEIGPGMSCRVNP